MTTRFVSQDIEWTESMKECVRKKVIRPLERYLHSENFEVSVHLKEDRKRTQARKPNFEMWLVLQTFDGRNNQIVRREGDDFHKLVNTTAHNLKLMVKRENARRRSSHRPFHNIPTVANLA